MHPGRRVLLAAALAAASVGLPVGAASAAEDDGRIAWSISPVPKDDDPGRPNFVYDLEEGGTVSDGLRVANFGARDLTLALYPSDAHNTGTGGIDMLPGDGDPTDVGSWITMGREEVTVAPGEHVDVPFTLKVPSDAESGDHVGGLVTSYLTPGEDAEGSQVRLDRRLAARVQVRVDGPLRPRLEVADLTTSYDGTPNPFGKGEVDVSYVIRNTGNVRLTADQIVRAGGPLGIAGRTMTLAPMPELLPGNSLAIRSTVPGLWPTLRTSTTVEIVPKAGRAGDTFTDADTVRASAGDWSVPWGQGLLLGLLGAAAGGVEIGRRGLKAREDRRVREAVAEHLKTPIA